MIGVAAKDAGLPIVTAAVVGGTISKITGGKFANGAITAAFGQALNGEQGAAEARKQLKFEKFIDSLNNLQDKNARKVFLDAGFTEEQIYEFRLANACSTRVSVAMNENGSPISSGWGFRPKGEGLITSVHELNDYLTETFGAADNTWTTQNQDLDKLIGNRRGIVLFMSNSRAAGANHATGWVQGAQHTTDNYYSTFDYDKVKFWEF
jgi:hypothetical protein